MYFPLFDKTPVTLDRSLKQRLLAIPGMTFFKDYRHYMSSLDADYAVGSPTATYTAARSASAPATYVDGAGIVQLLTTADVRRRQGGYYDATGFHAQSGEMIEEAGTNLITKANNVEDAVFTKTSVTANNADTGSSSPDNTATAPSLTATGANGTFLLATAVTARTYSVWLKRKTGTGTIQITADGGVSYDTVTLDTAWRRFQVTEASASQTCGIRIVTSGDALYVWGNQFEASPYATSFIPTTTAALTRPAEGTQGIKYETSSNRNANEETVFVKCAPFWGNVSINKGLIGTDTKNRYIVFGFDTDVKAAANITDSPSSIISNGVRSSGKNRSDVISVVYKHSSPYITLYINSSSTGTPETVDDFINPEWGTYFHVGWESSLLFSNALIQSVAIYNRALSAAEVLAVTNILNSGGL